MVEFLGRAEEADVALLDEVEEGNAAPEVLPSEEDDEAQVAGDETALRLLDRGLGLVDREHGFRVGGAVARGVPHGIHDRGTDVVVHAEARDHAGGGGSDTRIRRTGGHERAPQLLADLLEVEVRLVGVQEEVTTGHATSREVVGERTERVGARG